MAEEDEGEFVYASRERASDSAPLSSSGVFHQAYVEKCRELCIETVPEILGVSPGATILNLSEDTLGTKAVIALSYGLLRASATHSARFTKLNLNESYMGDDGCVELCAALRCNTSIRELFLSGANISLKGSVALSEVLSGTPGHPPLEVLSLEWNSIGSLNAGIVHLSDALKRHQHLRHLDLRNNHITAEGAEKLGEMLRMNSSLERLDVRWNSIGDTGASFFLDALQSSNRTLTELRLSGNEVQYATVERIRRLLERNKKEQIREEREVEFARDMDEKMGHVRKRQSEEIDSLKGRLGVERDAFESRIQESMQEFARMRKVIGDGHTRQTGLKAESDEHALRVEALESERGVLEARLKQTDVVSSQEIQGLKQQLEAAQGLQQETHGMLEKATREQAASKVELERLRTENVRLGESELRMTEDLRAKDEKLRDATARLRESLEDSAISSEKLLQAHKKVQALTKGTAKADSLSEEVQRLQGQLELARADAEHRVAEATSRMKLEHMQARRSSEEAMAREQTRARKLETQVELGKGETGVLQEKVDGLQRQLQAQQKNMNQKVESLRLANSALENEHATVSLENKQLTYSISTLQQTQRDSDRSHQKELSRFETKLEGMVEQHQREQLKMTRRVEEKDKEIGHLSREVQQLKMLVSTLKEQQEQNMAALESEIIAHIRKVVSSKKLT